MQSDRSECYHDTMFRDVYVLDISIEGSSQEELDASGTPYSDIDLSSDLDFDDLGKFTSVNFSPTCDHSHSLSGLYS